ncbi:Cation/H+ exchanger [Aspergillus floccosus]
MIFDPSDFNVICALLGLLMSVYGLLAYLIRERCYLSDALISFILGVLLGPATGLVDPMRLAQNDAGNIDRITSAFSRLVLGVQLVIVGIQLPKRYLIYEWRSLAVLLLPGLTCMWMVSSILVWLVLPPVSFLHALAIGACISPTDPVLSSAIVKGAFADKYVPLDLRRLIIAESGANDGLGYPFLFLPLLILRYSNSETSASGLWEVVTHWFGEIWFYVILLSIVYGAVLGWCAQSLLHFTAMREYLDRETFTIFSISLSLLVLGTAGMANSDDILACFVTGNSFTMK